MINLLPPDAKAEIRAGRANRLLVRYLFLFTGLMLLLFAAIGSALYMMQTTKDQAITTINHANQQSSELAKQQAQVNQFTANLATAKQILRAQTDYSTVLLRIASVIPSGVVLQGLTLDASTLSQPASITAYATNATAALALKNAFTSSSYFANTHFSTVQTNGKGNYPITIALDVNFTPELFK